MMPYKLTRDGVVSKGGINTGNFKLLQQKTFRTLKLYFVFGNWKMFAIHFE